MIATNNKRINDFAERLVDRISIALTRHAIGDTPLKGLLVDDVIRTIREESAKPQWQEPNIEPMLTISTAHLTPDAKTWIEECASLNQEACVIGNESLGGPIGTCGVTLYGYFMHAPENYQTIEREIGDMPASLWEACMKVREHGCAYVLFDRDADEIEGLPIYDEYGNLIDAEGVVAADDGGNLADELIEPGEMTMPESYIAPAKTIMVDGVIMELHPVGTRDLLKEAADLLDDALTTHIYDPDNGDVIPADDPYLNTIKAIRETLGEENAK